MRSRYLKLAIYTVLLAAAAAGALALAWLRGGSFPSWWVVLFGIGASLFVWQFGLRAPRLGLISMERLVHVGLLLVFEPVVAASVCAAASLIWPLVSRRYSQGSLTVAGLRAVHNASMTALMLLAAGAVYYACGGRHPLDGLQAMDVWPLVAMALTAQTVNIVLMMLFFHFDGREYQLRPNLEAHAVHGVGFTLRWQLESRTDTEATMSLQLPRCATSDSLETDRSPWTSTSARCASSFARRRSWSTWVSSRCMRPRPMTLPWRAGRNWPSWRAAAFSVRTRGCCRALPTA